MTRLLISVRDAAEARTALAGGADIIDVKEPRRGALGAADPQVLCAVRAAVDGRAPLSAALGELNDAPEFTNACSKAERDDASPLAGFQHAKLGLAGCAELPGWAERWQAALVRLPQSVEAVAVAYADWRRAASPAPGDVLRTGAELRCTGLLMDTFDKRSGDVFRWLATEELAALVKAAHAAGMFVAVGGSLTLATAPRAIAAGADIVAVRGAVCRGGRGGDVDAQRVRALAESVKGRRAAVPAARRQNA
jgi:uncharacterized protein (UPF0264 family)